MTVAIDIFLLPRQYCFAWQKTLAFWPENDGLDEINEIE